MNRQLFWQLYIPTLFLLAFVLIGIKWHFWTEEIGIILFAPLFWTLIFYRVLKPLSAVTDGAYQLAKGEIQHLISPTETVEIEQVVQAMNQMAAELRDKVATAVTQQQEIEAILSNMVEGVLMVDANEKIMKVNDAAKSLLDAPARAWEGKRIQEVIRNTDFLRLVRMTLSSPTPIEAEISLPTQQEIHLHCHGSMVRKPDGKIMGGMLVLHDITKLKKLENIRKEFVANVSHELKTPITSIKGFTETLIEEPDSENSTKFLEIIHRNAERLETIIEDILYLSKIEQENDRPTIQFVMCDLESVLNDAIGLFLPRAEDKNITINRLFEPHIQVRINTGLFEHAIGNLIENAIKYTDPFGQIMIKSYIDQTSVMISITDTGCGIAEQHLGHLFERFYRVDKSRSRTGGGTGLGLSIAKHIAQAHDGQITVTSQPNKGSTFIIRLPNSTTPQN